FFFLLFFFSSRRRHTRCYRDWSSDVCSSDLESGVRRVQEGATAVRFVNVLVQLQPEVVQRVGGVVGVAQGLRAGDRVRRGVQRGPDRVVGALLPVSGVRRGRALVPPARGSGGRLV